MKQLFPLQIVAELPRASDQNYRSVMANDQLTYLYKPWDKKNQASSIEYLCYALAGICGIRTPNYNAICDINDHSLFGFGSEYKDEVNGIKNLAIPRIKRIARAYCASQFLSELRVLDLFLHNTDRHPKNLLIAPQGKNDLLWAIDFADSLFHSGSPIGTGLPGGNTDSFYTTIFNEEKLRFDAVSAMVVLQKISAITTTTIKDIVANYSSWRTPELASLIDSWDLIKNERIKQIRQSLWNDKNAEILLFPHKIPARPVKR